MNEIDYIGYDATHPVILFLICPMDMTAIYCF